MPRSNVAFNSLVRNQSIDRGRLWEVSSDLLGIINAEGYFEVTNPAWEIALGWTSEAILNTSIFDLIHPDDVEKTRISLQEVAGAGSVLYFENRYRHKDGSQAEHLAGRNAAVGIEIGEHTADGRQPGGQADDAPVIVKVPRSEPADRDAQNRAGRDVSFEVGHG